MPEVVYNAMVLREPYSGVEITVHELLRAFALYGSFAVRAYVSPDCRALPQSPRLHVCSSRMGGSRLFRVLWEQTCLPAILRRTRAPLLHAPAYVAPLATPCPTVLTVHDLHVMTHPQFCSAANRLHYGALMPRSIRRAATIIAFSDYTRRNIVRHFPEVASRVVVIPPGVSSEFRRCEDAARLRAVKMKYALPDDFVLFVGDLTGRKNIGGLLSSFVRVRERHPDLHLVLAGSPTFQNVKGRRHVHCTGYIAQADMPALYSLARVFVFPSHDEGFGLPPLEAMACGCPVVCAGGAPVENCGAAALACDAENVGSIAEALLALLDNIGLRREKIVAGFQRAAAFTWEGAVRATEDVYRNVLRGKNET